MKHSGSGNSTIFKNKKKKEIKYLTQVPYKLDDLFKNFIYMIKASDLIINFILKRAYNGFRIF
jgi:hypothetical protein